MQARIPLETFVTDSQYMDKDQDFTFSADYAVDDFQVPSLFTVTSSREGCFRARPLSWRRYVGKGMLHDLHVVKRASQLGSDMYGMHWEDQREKHLYR